MLCFKFFPFPIPCLLSPSSLNIIYTRIYIDMFFSNHQTLPGTQWYHEARGRFWRFSFRDTSDMSRRGKTLHIFYASQPRIPNFCHERLLYIIWCVAHLNRSTFHLIRLGTRHRYRPNFHPVHNFFRKATGLRHDSADVTVLPVHSTYSNKSPVLSPNQKKSAAMHSYRRWEGHISSRRRHIAIGGFIASHLVPHVCTHCFFFGEGSR